MTSTSNQRLLALACAVFAMMPDPAAAVSYSAPFANAIRSVYGPRQLAESPLHTGIDFTAPLGTSVPSAADGVISAIRVDSNKCGARIYVQTTAGHELGYCHLFESTTAAEQTLGDFSLLKDVQFTFRVAGAQGKLRKPTVSRKCSVILNNVTGVALIPADCKNPVSPMPTAIGSDYAVSHRVAVGQLIAPAGNTGLSNPANAHLHMTLKRTADNPLAVVEHPEGQYCARLGADTTGSACATAGNPSFARSTLEGQRFIDVRIDATDRLDLDQIEFDISTVPIQRYVIQYGGSETSTPAINGGSDLNGAVSVDCSQTPQTGKVLICPLDFAGQRMPGARLETRFRLGIDPALFVPGGYIVTARMTAASGGSAQSAELPFTIPAPSATLLVPDTQANWSGLPATISLTDLVQTTRAAFQVSGNSATCGSGERGGPLFSSSVPADATFYAARNAVGVPYTSSGPGVNRRNCSSFVAVKMVPNPNNPSQLKPRLWINGTGRGQRFGGAVTLDWESQVRYDSGDPWSGSEKSCVGGTVANSGNFGANWSSVNCSATLNQ